VANPSALFLADRNGDVSGASVFAGMEGSRPVLVEIQSLIAPSALGTPRRAVVGWDNGRLAMLLAVLEARCGVVFGGADVYLNVAGGLRIQEPAADLAVAAALVSAVSGVPVPAETVVFGEVGLAGEVRPVAHMETRLKEAWKLGFTRAILPADRGKGSKKRGLAVPDKGMTLSRIEHVDEIVQLFGPGRTTARNEPGAFERARHG
jgi:DNA repair protein RadA/Sms